MVLVSGENIIIAVCRGFDRNRVELLRFPAVFRPINVIASKISVRGWRPNQIDERFLPRPARNSLQPGGCCGWKHVMSHDGNDRAIVASDLPRCSLPLGYESNDFNPVVV